MRDLVLQQCQGEVTTNTLEMNVVSLTHRSISVRQAVNLTQVLKLVIISLKNEEVTITVMKGHANRKHFYKGKCCDFAKLIHLRTKSRAN